MNDTINSIVDCETSWNEIQEKNRTSGAVTSLAVNAVCQKYIRDRQEQIRQERIQEQK
jgi:hypothetical protein